VKETRNPILTVSKLTVRRTVSGSRRSAVKCAVGEMNWNAGEHWLDRSCVVSLE